MKRKVSEKLLEWKDKKDRKPLILHGARQVGKTYIINEFGRQYFEDVIYINFETTQRFTNEFDSDISPDFIINRIELFFEKRVLPGKTLIFFDEIQVCERALTSLKYFCENAPEYHIISAGSLLGVALNREKYSFPVGKVDMLTLFALDFEEFLWAIGKSQLSNEIKLCFTKNKPMSEALHQLALEIYRTYLIVGGMPAVINEYINSNRIIESRNIQNLILNTYIADMAKYASPSDTTRILACYNSIPTQLAKENHKFQYKVVQKGGSASLFGTSLDWLLAAGIINKCSKIEHGYMPPSVYQDLSSFKIYMSDVGLLTLKSGIVPHDIMGEVKSPFIGAIAENYVANALSSNGFQLYYWTSKSQAEVDFIIQNYDEIIPIEVKANLHVKSRSLSVYSKIYKPKYSIRISAKNFGFENAIKSIPLYSVFCLKPQTPEL